MAEAEQLIPVLVEAGFVDVDDEADTWWFTSKGVSRARALEQGRGN
jgi:hypothetical protein